MNQLAAPEYVDNLRTLYTDRVPGGANLVAYWFKKARDALATTRASRAGLIATQSMRNGLNRLILKRIAQSGSIFLAWSDREWVNAGAAVRISMIGFDNGLEANKLLDGEAIDFIHPNLTAGLDLTSATSLLENKDLGFKGFEKNGDFELSRDVASKMLSAPVNPNGRSNVDVIKPWSNGDDITGRPKGMHVIDFGPSLPFEEAIYYEMPFQ